MYSFACKTLGLDCNYSTTDTSKEMVMKKAMEHGGSVHADIMAAMTQEQMAAFATQLDAAIKEG